MHIPVNTSYNLSGNNSYKLLEDSVGATDGTQFAYEGSKGR